MTDSNLIDRLAKTISKPEGIPRDELEWLVAHGNLEVHEAGTVIAPKGKHIDKLWIILSGYITVRVDRGTGPRQVTKWQTGEVSGMLPYSRMKGPPGDNYLEEKVEILTIHERHFPEMTNRCPVFTAFTVHSMLDRARSFNTSELHDEKMISLGKLAAGLAHELNNPASVAVRGAKMLLSNFTKADTASRVLGAAHLSDHQLKVIERFRTACLIKSSDNVISPMQQVEREEEITDWLMDHKVDPGYAEPLATIAITIDELNNLADSISVETLDIALKWITTGCATYSLAMDIEQAATRVSELVSAVKGFTHMDNLKGTELVNVETGLRDTIMVATSKAKSKNAVIKLDVEPNLPPVQASGGELNQVWMNLLDNALDAIHNSGQINITVRTELERVVVRIVDSGSGISPKLLSRIFDPFFTTKPPGQGIGLGLTITRRLLNRFNGDITVHSFPGRTEFCVNLLKAKPIK